MNGEDSEARKQRQGTIAKRAQGMGSETLGGQGREREVLTWNRRERSVTRLLSLVSIDRQQAWALLLMLLV